MRVLHERCAGADVHRDTVVVCVLKTEGSGVGKETRTFGTKTRELLTLRDWLEAEGVTALAIESTGVYWKPVCNVLEGALDVWLCNAQEVRHLPGRKTDVMDAEWLADLLKHGLVKRSFVPERPERELRDLTRYRSQIIAERTSEVNRLHKTLESANLKIGSVLSDITGVSGRAILEAIVSGETDREKLADMAVKRVRDRKRAELVDALDGFIGDHQRFMLRMLLEHIDHLDQHIEQLSQKLEELLRPFEDTLQRLDAIPGIARRAAQIIVAEVGTDMSRFPSAEHLASWSGLCPGNNQSGGRRRSGKTRKGSPWLRAIMVEAAWGSVHAKKSYHRSRYFRIRARRGPKKAAVAVAHALIKAVFHVLKGAEYRDLGPTYFDAINRDRLISRMRKRLDSLGYAIVPKETA